MGNECAESNVIQSVGVLYSESSYSAHLESPYSRTAARSSSLPSPVAFSKGFESGLKTIIVGQQLTPWDCQNLNLLSFITACLMSYLMTACLSICKSFSFSNFAEWHPTKATSGKLPKSSSRRSISASTWIQLMQQDDQKSTTTNLPLSWSWNDHGSLF